MRIEESRFQRLPSFTQFINENFEGRKVGFLLGKIQIPKIEEIVENFDMADLHEQGIEDFPHVTLLGGIHDPVDFESLERLIRSIRSFEIEFTDISSFENKDYDVLKLGAKSSECERINALLKFLPHTLGDHKEYQLHATLAYLKTGMAKKYTKKLRKPIKAKVEEFVYSDPDRKMRSIPLRGKP